jgi:hypothetical protein
VGLTLYAGGGFVKIKMDKRIVRNYSLLIAQDQPARGE